MLVEKIFPQVIGGKATLQSRLETEGKENGLSAGEINELVSIVPLKLLNSDCFHDRLTKLWRYEFGRPYLLSNNRPFWGTHMWPPVKHLFAVIRCANRRLAEQERRRYLERLARPEKHQDTLVEFLPILRVAEDTRVDFEVPTGVGGRNVDWRISNSSGRQVLVDVKRRAVDLLASMDRLKAGERNPDKTVPAPTHDVSLLFKSIEEKFGSNNPAQQLQGAWIVTALKQEQRELNRAFGNLTDRKYTLLFLVAGSQESNC